MLNTENYIEKYLPLFCQRELTEVLEVVLPKKQQYQLKKYNDFKIPILMHALFEDNGLPDL